MPRIRRPRSRRMVRRSRATRTQSARRVPAGFERRFAALRAGYRVVLGLALVHRARFVALFLAAVAVSFVLVRGLAQFLPSVDAGEIAIHVRAPIAHRKQPRCSTTSSRRCAASCRRTRSRASSTTWGCRTAGSTSRTQQQRHDRPAGRRHPRVALGRPRADRRLRQAVAYAAAACVPGVTFSFLPADIVSQILNFGAPAPIDRGDERSRRQPRLCDRALRRIRGVPGWPMRACSRRRPIRSSPCRSTARGPHNSASPSRTSPMRWSPACPAQARCRRPTGSIRTTACRIRSSRRRPSTG